MWTPLPEEESVLAMLFSEVMFPMLSLRSIRMLSSTSTRFTPYLPTMSVIMIEWMMSLTWDMASDSS